MMQWELYHQPRYINPGMQDITGAHNHFLGTSSWLDGEKQSEYAEFVITEDEETDRAIQLATRTRRPFGSDSFVDMLGACRT